MPVLYAMDAFLREFDSTLILITGTIDEILEFCEACEWLKAKTGIWFLCATCHPETLLVAPTAVPKLASAAWHAFETVPLMRNCRAGKAMRGWLPEDNLHKMSEGSFQRLEEHSLLQKEILESPEMYGEAFRKSSRKWQAEPDSFVVKD